MGGGSKSSSSSSSNTTYKDTTTTNPYVTSQTTNKGTTTTLQPNTALSSVYDFTNANITLNILDLPVLTDYTSYPTTPAELGSSIQFKMLGSFSNLSNLCNCRFRGISCVGTIIDGISDFVLNKSSEIHINSYTKRLC